MIPSVSQQPDGPFPSSFPTFEATVDVTAGTHHVGLPLP